jgi:hypothetical protein
MLCIYKYLVLSFLSRCPNWYSTTPSFVSMERTLAFGRGGGRSQFQRGDRHCGTLCICILCVTQTLSQWSLVIAYYDKHAVRQESERKNENKSIRAVISNFIFASATKRSIT